MAVTKLSKDKEARQHQIEQLEGEYYFYQVMVGGKSAGRFIAIEKGAIGRKGQIAGARSKFDEPNGAPDMFQISEKWLQENTVQKDAATCVRVHPRLAEFLLSA